MPLEKVCGKIYIREVYKSEFKGDINMIKLQEVKEEEQELLWNINQKYQYEITTYYSDKIDEQGN